LSSLDRDTVLQWYDDDAASVRPRPARGADTKRR
jgi:hypothetical protein